jgi:PPOX class probable F420-dependent enzyme
LARDGDVVVFTTHSRRRKTNNLRRDPRASITLFDPADPYNTVDIRGRVELVDDPAAGLSIELTRKYLDADPPPDPPGSHRLIARLIPELITGLVS